MDKIKILFIDDDVLNLMVYEENFNDQFTVFTASNGKKGLDILKENDIKIVITDMKMPNMNGIEFVRIASKQFADVKYYILTGFNISEEIQDAIDCGLIKRYFSKPINMVELNREIASF